MVSNEQLLLTEIQFWQKIIHYFDTETYSHCQKVANLCLLVGEILAIPQKHNWLIYQAALIHDLGKISLPIEILNKKEALSESDWVLIREHPRKGAEMAAVHHSLEIDPIIPLIICHHERVDGSGYPYGISGKQIPLGSQIIAVADALDVMTTFRPYREQVMTMSEAMKELTANSGTQFDAQVCSEVVRWFAEKYDPHES